MSRFAVVCWLSIAVACDAHAPLGASCVRNADCSAPLVCRIGRCRSECTANRDCPTGTECLRDEGGAGACSVPTDRGCGSGGTACGVPLTCVNDRCVNTCTDRSDCPADGECRAVPGAGLSFCFAPDGTDGGVPLDAARDDAGSDAGDDASAEDASNDAWSACATGSCDLPLCVGNAHACAVRGDGVVVCWGRNGAGELGDGTDDATARAHGDCNGEDCSPTPVEVLDELGQPLHAMALGCSEETTCAVRLDGQIACWGGNGGDGPIWGDPAASRPRRARVAGNLGGGFFDVVGGRYFFCARRGGMPADVVACWGDATRGQMGLGPSAVTAGGGVFTDAASAWGGGALTLGEHFTCTVRGTDVACAGDDDAGQLGTSATAFPDIDPSPVVTPAVTGREPFRLVAGNAHLCALRADRSIACRGWNGSAALGRALTSDDCAGVSGAFGPCDRDFAPIDSTLSFDRLFGEGGFTSFVCAMEASTERAHCWGATGLGTCISGASPCTRPSHVATFDHAIRVVAGTTSLCARFADGHVTCIGENARGELGRGVVGTDATVLRDAVPVGL